MKAEFDVGWLASAEADHYIAPCPLRELSGPIVVTFSGLSAFEGAFANLHVRETPNRTQGGILSMRDRRAVRSKDLRLEGLLII